MKIPITKIVDQLPVSEDLKKIIEIDYILQQGKCPSRDCKKFEDEKKVLLRKVKNDGLREIGEKIPMLLVAAAVGWLAFKVGDAAISLAMIGEALTQ